jgi:hypothetical protein
MKLAPGQTLKHACGLVLRNVRKSDIDLKGDECPQCHGAIRPTEIGSSVQEYTTWKLFPPHGMAFKNEMGSEVSIRFPKGQETELFQALQHQLNALIQASLPKAAPTGHAESDGQFMNSVKRAMSTKVTVTDDGDIVISDVDPTNPNATPNP